MGQRRRYGHQLQGEAGDTVGADGNDQRVAVPPVILNVGGDSVTPTGVMSGGLDARKLEDLITEYYQRGGARYRKSIKGGVKCNCCGPQCTAACHHLLLLGA